MSIMERLKSQNDESFTRASWRRYLIKCFQLTRFFMETIFEWIMDGSQLPPESICALRDVA